MVSLRTGLELEDTSRTNFGGLGREDSVLEHIPGSSATSYSTCHRQQDGAAGVSLDIVSAIGTVYIVFRACCWQ